MNATEILTAIYGAIEPIAEKEVLTLAKTEVPIVLKHLEAFKKNSGLIKRWFDDELISLVQMTSTYIDDRLSQLNQTTSQPTASTTTTASQPTTGSTN